MQDSDLCIETQMKQVFLSDDRSHTRKRQRWIVAVFSIVFVISGTVLAICLLYNKEIPFTREKYRLSLTGNGINGSGIIEWQPTCKTSCYNMTSMTTGVVVVPRNGWYFVHAQITMDFDPESPKFTVRLQIHEENFCLNQRTLGKISCSPKDDCSASIYITRLYPLKERDILYVQLNDNNDLKLDKNFTFFGLIEL
ncbi:tumor necrosis factor ligand superfamily member 6-like [Protopterus annectens]|uniref:tumor necrosis factor ligand superfamily member 6-like n=1 Tax=Protopterus annectens TaxID=7888 RepID=UPI001CF9A003|nr:tumor necrosis factor ligand superfamily member 6-like [Protopterus annectens]